ncbi:MAG: serine hydrolase domain-containing protein [Steroidobacteraceae bacterium]
MNLMAATAAMVALFTATPALAREALDAADVDAWVEGFFPYALARGDIAGAAVVIVRNGQVLVQRGYGYADVTTGARVDPAHTLFRTGSVGKLFTWTAVMQQVEVGRLDLDRDVNDYLDFRIPPREGKPVTLRNLMTHTPGFEEPIKRLVTDRPERLPTIEHYLKAWTPERIFPPGEVPAYSNYGVTLAGYILERVTGETYDDYIERQVFGPLGMRRSTTRQPLPDPFAADMSRGYLRGSGPAYPFELFGVSPAGGASTTATDMGRFMIAWLQDGALGGVRILQPETVRRVFETKLEILPPLNSMLLGFYEMHLNGRRIVGHAGDSQYFHGTLNLFPDDGIGVYVVVNSTGRDGAASTLLTRFMSEFADRYFTAADARSQVSAPDALAHARQIAGTYMSSRRQESNFFSSLEFLTQTKVTVDDKGGLLLPAMIDVNGKPMRWREITPYVWHQVDGKERLAARLKDGRVELLGIDSVSPFLVLQPVPWWQSSAILAPLLAAALIVILVAFAAWPLTALLRRHYRLWPAHAGAPGRPYRWTRTAAAGVLATFAAWAAFIAQLDGNLFAFSPALDPLIALLKLATAVFCAGGTALALWDAKRGWSGRRWTARIASILLVLAFGTVLWLAMILKLAGLGTDY